MFLMMLVQTLLVWLGVVLTAVFLLSLPELLAAEGDGLHHT